MFLSKKTLTLYRSSWYHLRMSYIQPGQIKHSLLITDHPHKHLSHGVAA